MEIGEYRILTGSENLVALPHFKHFLETLVHGIYYITMDVEALVRYINISKLHTCVVGGSLSKGVLTQEDMTNVRGESLFCSSKVMESTVVEGGRKRNTLTSHGPSVTSVFSLLLGSSVGPVLIAVGTTSAIVELSGHSPVKNIKPKRHSELTTNMDTSL